MRHPDFPNGFDLNQHPPECGCWHCKKVEIKCAQCGKVFLGVQRESFCSKQCVDGKLRDYRKRREAEATPDVIYLNAQALADIYKKVTGQ